MFQVQAGGKYGSPVQGQGIDPATCTGVLASGITGDPRYQYGAPGGSPYDAQTCAGSLTTPDLYTKQFDNFGQFTEPSSLTASMMLSYDVSPKITIQVVGTNLYNRCFGGSNVPWAQPGSYGCWYTSGFYDGNFYNPGNTVQQAFVFPYVPTFSTVFQQAYGGQANPANVYINAVIRF
jgi:hypothetical protein